MAQEKVIVKNMLIHENANNAIFLISLLILRSQTIYGGPVETSGPYSPNYTHVSIGL